MPTLLDGDFEDTTETPSFDAPGLADMQRASDSLTPKPRGAIESLAVGTPLAIMDLVDAVGSSLIPGVERGNINRAALNAIDSPYLDSFYEQNKGAIEVGSATLGIVGAELLTRKLVKPTSRFMRTVSKVPYARRIATLDAEYANAMQTVRNVDSALAARGAIGAEQYAGLVDLAGTTVSKRSAAWTAKGLGFAKGARNAAISEGILAGTMHTNDFLFDDSAAWNLAWMGLGVGIGGSAEWLHSTYRMRKFVNEDLTRRAFAGALDPTGAEEGRLLWKGRGDSKAGENYFSGQITDRITNLLVSNHSLRNTAVKNLDETSASSLLARRESLATQHFKLAVEESQKVTTRGIAGAPYSKFTDKTPGYANHLHMAMYRDPGVLYGVEMIGAVPDEVGSFTMHAERNQRIEEELANLRAQLDEAPDPKDAAKAQARIKQLEYESTLTPQVLIDGEKVPLSEAASIEQFLEPEIGFTKTDRIQVKGAVKGQVSHDQHGLFEAKTANKNPSVTLDTNFGFHLPGKRNLNNADHFDMLRLYRLGNQAADKMAQFAGPIPLPKKPNWFQLDLAEEVLRRNPNANVVFPAGMTRESAQVESLAQKAEALRARIGSGKPQDSELAKLRVRYNIPKLTSYERGLLGAQEHPIESLIHGIAAYGPDEIRGMDINELKKAASVIKQIGDFAPSAPKDFESFTGNSFKFMLDESGKPIKPIMMYSRPFQVTEWTQDFLAERMAANKMQVVGSLSRAEDAPMTRSIVDEMLNSPDLEKAARTHELMDAQIQGAFGSSPQSPFGAARNALVTSEWRDRDNPIMLAATRLRELVIRKARDHMKAVVDAALGDSLSRLENPRNATSKLLLNQFHSFRSGWDLSPNPVRETNPVREGEFYKFTLSDTKANRDRFKQTFGHDMPAGQTLLAPNGTEIVLDQFAMETQQAFNFVTDSIIKEKNALLRANGRGEIARLDWYTPPQNTNGKYIGFVLGPDNKPVPGMTVVEDTQEAFNRSREALAPKMNELGLGYTFRTRDEIRGFASIWDRAQMDFIDPSTTAVQPGKLNRGTLAGNQIRTDAFNDSLQYVRDQYLKQADDIIESMMKESINSSKARANIAGGATRNKAGFYREQKYRSIYDMYLENLLGKSKLNSSGSFVGRIYNSIEGTIDKFLEAGTPTVSKVWIATNDWINKLKPWDSSESGRKDFEALSKKLGKYMPFESAVQMLERQGAGATPPTLAKITGGINRFTAALLLRMFEVAHPIMNLSGIVNAMPSVIRAATDGKDAAFVTSFNLPGGKSVSVVDMSKIASRAFKRAWSRESEADYKYMVQHGFLSQEVAEFQRQFGAIDSPGKFMSFFNGNAGKATEGGVKGKFYDKGLVGWLSILSDKSEDFSRSWGHMVGLELADMMKIQTREQRHAFAHEIANKMIANYSPQNRPEIFQGAMGAPIGLFQSFVMNYYQRLFRYLETKNYQALGMQYAMQSGLFGVTGIPGFQQFSKFMTDDQGHSAEDGFYERFQGPLGDLLGAGILSNIPKIFGADAVDLYSRGDVNPRIPGVPTGTGSVLDAIPGTAVLRKIYDGIAEGLQQFDDAHPGLSGTQLAEVASNMIANRPLSGMIEQFFAGGNDTDRYGQLVNDTQSASEMAYRLIGLRSLRQSEQVNAFYANKNAMEHQAAAKDILRLATRAAMRDGTFEDKADEIFTKYLENGGDPRHFRRWLKENYEAATESRAQRQLDSAVKGGKFDQALRLIDANVGINDDEATEDPADTWQSDMSEESNEGGL